MNQFSISAIRSLGLGLSFSVSQCCSLAWSQTPRESESSYSSEASDSSEASQYADLFSEALELVQANFFDEKKLQGEFAKAVEATRARAVKSQSDSEFATCFNELLSLLATSHTVYLTPDDLEYYQIAAIFSEVPRVKAMLKSEPVMAPTIGIVPRQIDGRWWVASVLPGGSAAEAGVRVGDELRLVNSQAYSPVAALRKNIGAVVDLQVSRNEKRMSLRVRVDRKNPSDEFLEALENSMQVLDVDGKKVGYAHLYSYAGEQYQKLLQEQLAYGKLKEAEALVLDLRYGLGGASPRYLNMFNRQIPTMTSINKAGERTVNDTQWRKPCVVLIDGSSRSGKEVFAYGAKKYGYATVLGNRTAGGVVAGSPFPLRNGHLMYLAVQDVEVDGERLEGRGVAPDVLVNLDLPTCNGVDAQFEAAIQEAAKMVEITSYP